MEHHAAERRPPLERCLEDVAWLVGTGLTDPDAGSGLIWSRQSAGSRGMISGPCSRRSVSATRTRLCGSPSSAQAGTGPPGSWRRSVDDPSGTVRAGAIEALGFNVVELTEPGVRHVRSWSGSRADDRPLGAFLAERRAQDLDPEVQRAVNRVTRDADRWYAQHDWS
jgi:hypothetical protein